jgi:DNA-binding winged helix-turn-helix (wHTH) protein
MAMTRFGPYCFAEDFVAAKGDGGQDIAFTRSEARVLAHLVARAGRIVTRSALLDVISEVGSDKSDRNIDFIVNRLRRKLGDKAREPRFIATRYGEGYVWLAQPEAATSLPRAAGAHVVIGPLRGLRHLGGQETLARAFAQGFQESFAAGFGADRKVVYDPDCPPRAAFGDSAPEIAVDLTFVADRQGLECVVQATAFRSGSIYSISRHAIAPVTGTGEALQALARSVAAQVGAAIWKGLTLKADRTKPLPVAMQDASLAIGGGIHGWAESHRRLQELAAQNPTDHGIKMMLATNLHTKWVQHGLEIFASGQDTTAEDDAEIEALVTASLPFVQQDPFFATTAAKLLFLVDPGYRGIAMDLIEEVNRYSTAIAASLTTLGMLRNFMGQTGPALSALNQALDLTEPGSEFEVYILCLKCQVYMAVNDREGLDEVLAHLYQRKPTIRFLYDIFYGRADALSPEALGALSMMTPAQARGMLRFVDYMCARYFADPEHRENTLRIPREILSRHFGPEVVPNHLAVLVPV